jgi:hypothetical protein
MCRAARDGGSVGSGGRGGERCILGLVDEYWIR